MSRSSRDLAVSPTTVRRHLALVLAALMAFSVTVSNPAHGELPPGGTFTDDDGNVHEGWIEAVAAEGITQGCDASGTLYCPRDPVTRAQMASFLARALDLSPSTTNRFGDDNGSVHEQNIDAIADLGITLGCDASGTVYCPDDPVSRQQMASFLARALDDLVPATRDYFTDDGTSVHQDNINLMAENGITLGCDPTGTLYCPLADVNRDQMATFLGRALGLTEMIPPPRPTPTRQLVASGLSGPLLGTTPDGDPRLFIVEKGGFIAILENGAVRSTKFLSISSLISNDDEQGLLGMAFHPQYSSNGLFYVSYTDTGGDSVIDQYQVSSDPNVADPNTRFKILEIDQPFANHNGGMITFGADGYLYFGLGDGGGADDPLNHGENPTTLLGSILRIDVDTDDFDTDPDRNYGIPSGNPFVGSGSGADEVWAYGLRNPWRFSFDSESDTIYIGDVGQGAREEISASSSTVGGLNYGWDVLEGSICHEPSSGCSSSGTVLPVVDYGRSEGQSVTGGFVYRGTAIDGLDGVYFYGDAGSGRVWSFRLDGGIALEQQEWTDLSGSSVWGFGRDSAGELYIMSGNGSVYKIVP